MIMTSSFFRLHLDSSEMFAVFLFRAMLSIFRVFGYRVDLHKIYPSIINFSVSSPSFKITLDKISISFRFPSATIPHWATITAYGYTYTNDESLVRCKTTTITLWFFPVLFRHTAGPWATTILDGFSVHIFTSEKTPKWIQRLRDDISYSILNGETICFHHLKTRIQLSGGSGSNNHNLFELAGPQAEANRSAQLSFSSSQWQIINPPRRMYHFGNLELTFWRDWLENRGSVTLFSEDSQWIELPDLTRQEVGKFWQIFQGLCSFPSNVIKAIINPLATVDIVVRHCTVEFDFFRLRDAGLMRQVYTKFHLEHQKFNDMYPGLFQEIIFDMLAEGLTRSISFESPAEQAIG